MAAGDDDGVERLLLAWGGWMRSGGRVDVGYPVRSVLHPDWSPGRGALGGGVQRIAGDDVRLAGVHALLGRLSGKLQATAVAVYVRGMSSAQAAGVLACEPATVRARVVALRGAVRRAGA